MSPNKKEFVMKEGIVLESLPNTHFRIKLDSGEEVIAYLSGKLRKYRINVLPGDRVRIELSPYDREKGRITYRLK